MLINVVFKLKSINEPLKSLKHKNRKILIKVFLNKKALKLLKHKNGKILIKVFLKMKKLKINKNIKIIKTRKREKY